ncbi:MAG: LLM class flavin-dependent oxidoreductase [Chloroflexi bacterium]|nr:LLM class flavin-dependent oxidoreductase [Chloroflexota bacterium]
MNYGYIITTGGPAPGQPTDAVRGSAPRTIAQLAGEAEAAGWDGVFFWDAIAIGDMEIYDPWVVLAAMAMRTERVRIGAIVTPPSRRRPWKLARETMTLDHLSGGRLILPVGLGALDDAGFGAVGEPTEARTRAELLDESLAILQGLWIGKPFGFQGRHYRFDELAFRPATVQQPRIPIWVAAAWPRERSMRRALRYDGLLAQAHDDEGRSTELTTEHVRAIAEYVSRERPPVGGSGPFEIVVEGATPAGNAQQAADRVSQWAEAGATWWVESDWKARAVDSIRRRIGAGPPRP